MTSGDRGNDTTLADATIDGDRRLREGFVMVVGGFMKFREIIRLVVAGGFMLMSAPTAWAVALPVCEGGDRAERKLTCIVDGDTGWENGVKWRYDAIDAPEMPEHAECTAEAGRAIQSRDWLRELMGNGYTINWSGEQGHYDRELVTITLADGRDAGAALMAEHLAQPWPNDGNVWCGW